MRHEVLLMAEGVEKSYGATRALQPTDFTLYRGQVCGLLGENGAGKSTLIKLLSGVVNLDNGRFTLDGQDYRPEDVIDARNHGVATAFQELSLSTGLNVAANLALPDLPTKWLGMVDRRKINERARQILKKYKVDDISPTDAVESLQLGQRQRLEILRAVTQKPKLLLLDEPTAALADREWLFDIVRQITAEGTSVLYISHKLDEIRTLCERCIVLCGGVKVLEAPMSEVTDDQLFALMAGTADSEQKDRYVRHFVDDENRESLFELDNVSDPFGGIRNASLNIKKGEIVGLAALEGQGQDALFEVMYGTAKAKEGRITLDGQDISGTTPYQRNKAGLAIIPQERKSEAIFEHLPSFWNFSYPVLGQFKKIGLISERQELNWSRELAKKIDIRPEYLSRRVKDLSGGNQQKVVLARALAASPKFMLLFDPSRGVDVGTKETIYEVLDNFVSQGGAVLLYSTELEELIGLCDRCYVLYDKTITHELQRSEMTTERLLALASGYETANA